MQWIFELSLILAAFLSLIPVVNMYKNRHDQKYNCLKVLIYSAFIWTILMIVERISTMTIIVYYANMIGYPMRLWLASLMLCTIYQYADKKFPDGLKISLGILVLIDLGIALTNSWTQYFLALSSDQLITFNDLYTAIQGPLFVYHLIISYSVALVAIAFLFSFLAKKRGMRQYKEVTRMMAISVIAVLAFNALQLFVVTTNVNLTYISLIFVAYMLYDVIYRKDMVFNLRASGRSEILTNMREMYILTNGERNIVEMSPLLIEKYQLQLENVLGQPFEYFVNLISNHVTLYDEYHVDDDTHAGKDHYHLREKQFKLKGMKESGFMMLLYDETQVYNLLRELNRLSHYDVMTGLHNRNYIEHKLSNFKKASHLGVISIDLNGLKINNDYFGHERGDFLLKAIAEKMRKVFSRVITKDIARIGGDEFMIIVHGLDLDHLQDKVQELIDECHHEDLMQKVSLSIGVAYDEEGSQSIYQLIQHADEHMYQMKQHASKEYRDELMAYIALKDQFIR